MPEVDLYVGDTVQVVGPSGSDHYGRTGIIDSERHDGDGQPFLFRVQLDHVGFIMVSPKNLCPFKQSTYYDQAPQEGSPADPKKSDP